MPESQESFGTSFTTDPNNGTFTQVPWYIEKNLQNEDMLASRRSRLSNTNSTVAWSNGANLKMSQTQIEPERFGEDMVSLGTVQPRFKR